MCMGGEELPESSQKKFRNDISMKWLQLRIFRLQSFFLEVDEKSFRVISAWRLIDAMMDMAREDKFPNEFHEALESSPKRPINLTRFIIDSIIENYQSMGNWLRVKYKIHRFKLVDFHRGPVTTNYRLRTAIRRFESRNHQRARFVRVRGRKSMLSMFCSHYIFMTEENVKL